MLELLLSFSLGLFLKDLLGNLTKYEGAVDTQMHRNSIYMLYFVIKPHHSFFQEMVIFLVKVCEK